MTDIAEKTWAGWYKGPEGVLALFESEWRVMGEAERRENLVRRASAYYSAATNHFRKLQVLKGLKYLSEAREAALRATGRVVLSADQCDVLQSVFCRTAAFVYLHPFKWGGDLYYAETVLDRAENLPKELHTQALLLTGRFEVMYRLSKGDDHARRVVYEQACQVFGMIVKKLNAADVPLKIDENTPKEIVQLGRQASRIARRLAWCVRMIPSQEKAARTLKQCARNLAAQYVSQDQMLKAS